MKQSFWSSINTTPNLDGLPMLKELRKWSPSEIVSGFFRVVYYLSIAIFNVPILLGLPAISLLERSIPMIMVVFLALVIFLLLEYVKRKLPTQRWSKEITYLGILALGGVVYLCFSLFIFLFPQYAVLFEDLRTAQVFSTFGALWIVSLFLLPSLYLGIPIVLDYYVTKRFKHSRFYPATSLFLGCCMIFTIITFFTHLLPGMFTYPLLLLSDESLFPITAMIFIIFSYSPILANIWLVWNWNTTKETEWMSKMNDLLDRSKW